LTEAAGVSRNKFNIILPPKKEKKQRAAKAEGRKNKEVKEIEKNQPQEEKGGLLRRVFRRKSV
jgi:hypothetical protein